MRLTILLIIIMAALTPGWSQRARESFIEARNLYLTQKELGFPTSEDTEKTWDRIISLLKSSGADSALHYLALACYEKSFVEYANSQYAPAIETALDGLKYSEQAKSNLVTQKICYHLGNCYSKIGSSISGLETEQNRKRHLKQARYFMGQAITLAYESKDQGLIFQSLTGLSNYFISVPHLDSARIICEKIVREAPSTNHKVLASTMNALGIIAFESGDYSTAGKQFRLAIIEARKLEKSLVLSSAMGNLANVLVKEKKYVEAAKLLHELILLNKTGNRKQALSKNLITLAGLYKEKGLTDSALYYTEQYYLYKDSILNEAHTTTLKELEAKYDSEKKEKDIRVLQLANLQKENSIRKKTLWLGLSGALTILTLTISWSYFHRRSLKEKRAAAEMKQQLLSAQMNPHFLFNALNSIQRLYVDGRIEEGNQFMSDFAHFVREVLDKTGRSRIPLYEEIDFLHTYLSLEKKRLGEKFDYRIKVPEELQHSMIEVPSLISQPLAENALVHGILPRGEKGMIDIEIRQDEAGLVSFTIKDNGVGFEQTNNKRVNNEHRSRGLELIRSRLGRKGRLQIESLQNKSPFEQGTIATLYIPI